jgi:hypothetical protein
MPELELQATNPEDRSRRKHQSILAVQEVMFCLNIACAVGYAFLAYIYNNYREERAANDSTYYFLRSAFRINDLFHVKSMSAVNPDAVARQFEFRWNQVGYDLLAVISVFGVAALLLLLLRLASDSASYRRSLCRAAGLAAIFAAPLSYLYFVRFFSDWRTESFLFPALASLRNPATIFSLVEVFCVPIVLVLFRKHRIPLLPLNIFVSFHCLFWALMPWPAIPLIIWDMYAPYLFVAVLALSGIAWLLFASDIRTNHSEIAAGRRAGKWTVGVAAAAMLTLLLLWIPPKSHSMVHPKDLDSLAIDLARGPCFGSCIVYTLTIRGNGQVDLVHQPDRRVPDLGPQRKTITREQLSQILESLDRANFFAFEDRAFSWCFDTPSVGISVSMDGRTKRVVSDSYCIANKSGIQGRFVESAAEIDRIVGTENMLSCPYGPCGK